MNSSSDTANWSFDKELPVVDLGAFTHGTEAERRNIAGQVDDICRSIGFLVIDNHGVSHDACESAWSMAKEFFELPLEKKLAINEVGCPRGYSPVAAEALSQTRGLVSAPDNKESFSCGPLEAPPEADSVRDFDFFYGPNIWPDEPAEFFQAWSNYYRQMEVLGMKIMGMLAVALNLDEDYFVSFHRHALSALRGNNYPAFDVRNCTDPRSGAHSDYGTLTILKADPDIGGLDVQLPSGSWLSVTASPNTFIINLGDLMARWTNDRWVSTLHRVALPEGVNNGLVPRRQSIPFFMHPDYDATISAIPTCLAAGEKAKYKPVSAGEYLIKKYQSSLY